MISLTTNLLVCAFTQSSHIFTFKTKSYVPNALLDGIGIVKEPEVPDNEASTIGVKPDNAFVPAETEYNVGEFCSCLYME